MLPNFLIVGAQKSGTTSLAAHLGEHPDVLMLQTPVYFFNRYRERGLDWYEKQFSDADHEAAVGEGTPEYMYHQHIPPLIAESLPDVKLIAILRNPVDRAYSHYWHNRTRGHEPLGFGEAVAAEPTRLAGAETTTQARFSYLDRGHYLRQLENLCQSVPRERLHVAIFEDMRDNPAVTVKEAFVFLAVDPSFTPRGLGHVRNEFVTFRSQRLREPIRRLPSFARKLARRLNVRHEGYQPMDAKIRSKLTEYFGPDNEALEAWLKRDLTVWRS